MRLVFQGTTDAVVGTTGFLRVELSRTGLPTLFDERSICIVDMPPAHGADHHITLPPFKVYPIDGLDDPKWAELGWIENTDLVASSAQMEEGVLVIYYSSVLPKYAGQRASFEQRDPVLARSFTNRYEIWLAVHSLLLHHDQQELESQPGYHETEQGIEAAEQRERQERCRLATIAALVAAREVRGSQATTDLE